MKLRVFLGGCALGAAVALVGAQAISQDAGQMPSPEQMQEMMQEYMATLQPGPAHRALDPSIGSWDTTTKMWWGGPGSEPVVTTGTAERKWILDGRFMLEEMTSEIMMPDPSTGQMKAMPWQGMGLFGYDNYRKMYVGAWADSMSTALLRSTGSADPSGTVFTYYGEMDEPMLGVVGRMVKYVTKRVSENTEIFSIYDLHAGNDYKVLEITYRRKS
ncbi:MAG: DUF1579 domain-containing protein [Planctomycetota bacterium]|jgi:hypothetical protein